MNKKTLDIVWDQIEDDLNLEYHELNRDALYKAIQQLPLETAPDHCWGQIESELSQRKFEIHWSSYLKIAASVIILLGIGFLIQQQFFVTEHIHYAKSQEHEFNLFEISDTTADVFQQIKNSTCDIKPAYCRSEEFKQFEDEYHELQATQEAILQKSKMYQDEHMESMMLKIEERKKKIEQYLITQIN